MRHETRRVTLLGLCLAFVLPVGCASIADRLGRDGAQWVEHVLWENGRPDDALLIVALPPIDEDSSSGAEVDPWTEKLVEALRKRLREDRVVAPATLDLALSRVLRKPEELPVLYASRSPALRELGRDTDARYFLGVRGKRSRRGPVTLHLELMQRSTLRIMASMDFECEMPTLPSLIIHGTLGIVMVAAIVYSIAQVVASWFVV